MTEILYPTSSEIISRGALKIYMLEPGILVTECVDEVHIDMHTALEIHKIGSELIEFKNVANLVLASPGLTTTKEVRDWGASEKANEFNLATAVVTKTLPVRMIGNFFIKIQNPPRPTKLFTSSDEAVSWLRGFLK